MAGDKVIATLDVAPEVLADFAPVIGRLAEIVGSAECETGIRLRLLVPAELGPRVLVIATQSDGSISYHLAPAP